MIGGIIFMVFGFLAGQSMGYRDGWQNALHAALEYIESIDNKKDKEQENEK